MAGAAVEIWADDILSWNEEREREINEKLFAANYYRITAVTTVIFSRVLEIPGDWVLVNAEKVISHERAMGLFHEKKNIILSFLFFISVPWEFFSFFLSIPKSLREVMKLYIFEERGGRKKSSES